MDTDPASYLVFNSEFQSSSNLYSAVSSVENHEPGAQEAAAAANKKGINIALILHRAFRLAHRIV